MQGDREQGRAGDAPRRKRGVRNILIVDDSRTDLNGMGQRLGDRGYLPVLCDNGAQALDLIAGRGFDLVLLDLMMPGLSGIQVLRELRSARETTDLPVIIVSGRDDPNGPVEALRAGADDYLVKPLALEVLVARIERALDFTGRLNDLKRFTATLDARVAARAIELGEARDELAAAIADRKRLARSLRQLNAEVERLSLGTSAAG
ncbi:response regulator [Stakelama marina]|uniref:Response regulator n=1 Tax=Stakelama marina TaxID=2826939 RepID=A0A8T4IET0_9SPHN|nr:response regulator [Stakelama marina]MBR0553147.1 response regulator [Stakelama marina]